MFVEYFLLWLGAAVAMSLAACYVTHRVSPHERERRKRRRNYGPVISRARRPVVKLSVNAHRA